MKGTFHKTKLTPNVHSGPLRRAKLGTSEMMHIPYVCVCVNDTMHQATIFQSKDK